MQLGVMLEGQDGLTWDLWRRIMARVEELGFESLWCSDHFMSIVDSSRDALETWAALTLTAAETTRLRFGSLVCPMTFRHPSLLARMATAVDILSGGRLVLGVGAGWNELEHRAFGIPFPPLRERMHMLEEGIEVLMRLLGDGPAHFAGRHYQLDGANPRPKPTQRPRIPLLIGTTGTGRMLRMVARYADEWDAPGITSPTAYRTRSERLTAYCRDINRNPDEIRRGVSTAYIIGRNTEELRHRGEIMQQLIPDLAAHDPGTVPDILRAEGWLVGTPEQIVGQLRALADEGVQRVIFQHNDQTDFAALELLARDVLPVVASTAYGSLPPPVWREDGG
ncbi:MAG TPA: TIGR03560 family F420-dependent LLM class oxidoreductase [Candidatus Tectomicrobia bacterium]|jgi:F420-dependent oxidoreductase-like protein